MKKFSLNTTAGHRSVVHSKQHELSDGATCSLSYLLTTPSKKRARQKFERLCCEERAQPKPTPRIHPPLSTYYPKPTTPPHTHTEFCMVLLGRDIPTHHRQQHTRTTTNTYLQCKIMALLKGPYRYYCTIHCRWWWCCCWMMLDDVCKTTAVRYTTWGIVRRACSTPSLLHQSYY